MTCYECGEMRDRMLAIMCEYCKMKKPCKNKCEFYHALNLAMFNALRKDTTTCEMLNKF